MAIFNTHERYGAVAIALHWVMALWLGGLVAMGLYMVGLPDASFDKLKITLIHLSFYGLMFALPVSGLLMSSAAAIPVSAFGVFDLPDLVAPSEALFRRLIQVHRWLGYALLLLIGLHAGAALMHHFVKRDHTLKKMLSPNAAR